MNNIVRGLAVAAALLAPALAHAAEPGTGEARAFPSEKGVVDLLVIGEPAKVLYARLPGKGKKSECNPDGGLYKGNGRMQCVKDGNEYSCHVWLDVPMQKLTDPESDDC